MKRRVSHIRKALLWSSLLPSTLLVMQSACQTQKQKTPQDTGSLSSEGPHVNSTLDDASRANMGSQAVQFVKQAEKQGHRIKI